VLLAALWLVRRKRAAAPASAGAPLLDPWPSRPEWIGLGLVSLTGLVLRLHGIGADLWIDEIATLHAFRDVPPLTLVTRFLSANNHLLNTLLVKAATRLFGEAEWAVRMPAVAFGTATVPLLWLASRRALGSRGALLAALLLATSYHHVFFSQNARGYSALLFFSIAGAALLSAGLRAGRPRVWLLYVVAMLGALASLLHAFFVLAAHAAIALWSLARRGRGSPAGRALAAVALATWGGLHLYAFALAEAAASVGATYRTPAMGYRPLSAEHLQEWGRAVHAVAGPGGLLVAAAGLLVAAPGFRRLHHGDAVLAWGLLLPPVLIAAGVLAAGLNATPRTYLLLLPFALLCGTAGLLALADLVVRPVPEPRRAAVTTATLVGLALAAVAVQVPGLRSYYRHPKQDFRGAIRFAEVRRRPGDVLVAVYLAKWGLRHYGPRLGLQEGRDFEVVQSVEDLEAVRRARPGARLLPLVTLARANRLEYPDLDARLHADFDVVARFPGTLGDGEVSVWEPR
jgi:hypothetical protein